MKRTIIRTHVGDYLAPIDFNTEEFRKVFKRDVTEGDVDEADFMMENNFKYLDEGEMEGKLLENYEVVIIA